MKKKFLKITIVAILLVLVYTTIVNALGFTATMTSSSSNVEPSSEFTVKVSVSNLDVGDNGINQLNGTLSYDEDVFEEINDSSIEGLDTWSHSYDSEAKTVKLTKTTFVKKDEEVFQVTFKTKADVKSGTVGKINFTGITASNSEQSIPATDVSISITVGGEPINTANVNSENQSPLILSANTNSNTNTNTNTNVNKIPVNSYIDQENKTEEEVPYTGVEDTLIYLVGAFIILAIIFYIKFEKVNSKL